MALRPIVRLGHPSLRTAASAVEVDDLASEPVQTLIADMLETMEAAEGVGLAAPQLGLGLRLFVYGAPEAAVPLTVVVNPRLQPEPGELELGWEGCLSIPDLRGLVPRHRAVLVSGLDRQGRPFSRRVEGYEARIVQHENDHLHGIIFLDRMDDMSSLAHVDEWERAAEAAARRDEEDGAAAPADGEDPGSWEG